MPAKHKFLLKFTAFLTALKALGSWGLLIMATLDSAAVPMPLDAMVAGYVYSNHYRAWLYCLAAALGSAFGSLLPYALGRAGGELFLLKRIDEARLQRIRDRFEKQEFLALMLPAILPPPTPFKLLVFSAGVFEMKVVNFLLAITLGRIIRFGILSVLTIRFGPQIVSEVRDLVKNHLGLTLGALAIIAVIIYVVFRLVKAPVSEVAHEIQHPTPPPVNGVKEK